MSSAFVLCSGEVAIELAPLLYSLSSSDIAMSNLPSCPFHQYVAQCYDLNSRYIPGPTGFQQLVAATVISFNPVSRDYTSHLAFIFSLFAHIAASFWFLGLAGKHGKSFNAARFHVTRSAGYLTAASRLLVNTVAEPVFIFARFCLLFVLVDVKFIVNFG
ncbi:hypothetical protein C8J56DRAFT_1171763 [Mycena floridula]|nr:hypothetical protein C8J56DRAFT_1171763 [Mycena floridula]